MNITGNEARRRAELISSIHGNVVYTPQDPRERKLRAAAPPTFPSPRIRPRQRRSHAIHILSFPPGFIPADVRPEPPPRPPRKSKRTERKEAKRKQQTGTERPQQQAEKSVGRPGSGAEVFRTRFAALFSPAKSIIGSGPISTEPTHSPQSPRHERRRSSLASLARCLSRSEPTVDEESMMRTPIMIDTTRPPLAVPLATSSRRNSILSVRSAKRFATSSVAEVQKPVATGSGVTCSIWLAEPNVFLTGFDHDGRARPDSQNATALLRGKLQLSVTKNIKVKGITLKLTGKARTEWPEGIPPLKVDQFEEETLRTQSLVFFHAMHVDMWETEYGNQCNYHLKGNSQPSTNFRPSVSPAQSVLSLNSTRGSRQNGGLTPKELRRLSLQSVNSRSFGKSDNPAANAIQAKGYKVFYPGTYEYTFELPIDHHQLETTKLPYGSVKWELEATVERAGAFKPNLRGTKEVSIVRVPDQLSLEMSEPISISRQWEDQMHYDIVISGKSFPIGSKIPIAFKLMPLAKVQLHKLKVFVTESVEYRTNDRRVTRKDPGRKILLLEKAAGKPLEKKYEQSELRIVSGGELSVGEQEEARQAAGRRRALEAARTNRVAEPLPDPADNLLGALDLGLESYWGSTEIEMNVQMPTCDTIAKDKSMRLHPDCSWKNANVYHWIKVVLRISRLDPEDPAGKRRRHFEISIDSPFTVLNCRATQANTSLPRYSGQDRATEAQRQATTCGCPDAHHIRPSPSGSTISLTTAETGQEASSPGGNVTCSALPAPPQAAHLQSIAQRGPPTRPESWPSSPLQRVQNVHAAAAGPSTQPRPMELLRCPSYNPPAFDADEPPPALGIMTPPPNYDAIIGTPSVDGLADYFTRLADYEDPEHEQGRAAEGADYLAASGTTTGQAQEEEDEDSDSGDEHHPARIHAGGRVNVANPRTPGGRLAPSRSLEIERPVMRLNMAGVVRRGE